MGLENSHQTECLNRNGHGKSGVNRQFISERRNYSELQYIVQRYDQLEGKNRFDVHW